MFSGFTHNSTQEVTLLISQASSGNQEALNSLIALVYEDLKLIASGLRHKQFNSSSTLNTTSVVDEAWLRLHKWGIQAESRKHFFCIAAKAMRQILINSATQKLSQKRNAQLVTFDDSSLNIESEAEWMLLLDKILKAIEKKNSRMADVFQLKYFLGFSEPEISEVLNVSVATVNRDWLVAKKIIKEII